MSVKNYLKKKNVILGFFVVLILGLPILLTSAFVYKKKCGSKSAYACRF